MLAHVTVAEDNRSRLWLLKHYARHEVRLLKVLYRLLPHVRRSQLLSEIVYWTLAYPSARWGITGTPVSPVDLDEFFAEGSRIAVGPCRCRIAHGGCDHPIETDIVIRTGFPVWTGVFPRDYREISALEAIEVCSKSHELGMAQVAYAHLDVGDGGSMFVLCNCCADGCLPLLTMKHYGNSRYPMHRGRQRAYVESEMCEGCGTCIEMCVFGARRAGSDGKAIVEGCYGCGLCASHCPTGATRLI